MRQLKTFMRNRKAEMLGCGPCVCRTLQCWRYAAENCGCGEGVTEDMDNYILNWFRGTSVFNDLTPEQKEQALADAQEILEGAGDGIAPFYNAVRQGRTFSNYASRMGLDVDENGPCDSSLYEDEEAFIIYIGTAGAIDCKYLALVARRGRTPNKELINKEAISNYLDWVTTEMVTYQFKDWDDEILSFGSVKKGETPTAPTDLPPRPNYRFTGWSPNVGKIEYDTTFVAQYEAVTPIQVQSMSNITLPEGDLIIPEGGSVTFTFDYLPANANDFSNVTFEESDECYESPRTSASVTSYSNGTATVTVQGLAYSTSNDPDIKIYLNGVQQGDSKNMQVRPYAEVAITPEGAGTIALSKPLYIPYGGTLGFSGFGQTSENPATVDIYDGDTIVDTLTITAAPKDGYEFVQFEGVIGSYGYRPEDSRAGINCDFTLLP